VDPTACGECGGPVVPCTDAIPFQLRGETLAVLGVEHGRCERCGEVYLDMEAAGKVQREAVRQARASRGLMTPQEIRALRVTLGVSQAKLERLLGTGPKTVVRWEKGTVFQSATADRLMRLLSARPQLAALLEDGPRGAQLGGEGRDMTTAAEAGERPARRRRAG
jgi:HTH-type transcriptional regulator / antitoxin MqsA